MFFDLSKLSNKSINTIQVHEKVEIKEAIDAFGEKIIFNDPVEINGSFEKKESYIEFNGNVNCDLKLQCSRCLGVFDEKFDVEIQEEFSKTDSEGCFLIPSNGEIDLSEIIVENIVGYLPIQKRCSDNCKGLCPQCGTNLNLNQCDCEPIIEEDEVEDTIDPRLAKLQNFFNKN